MDFLRDILTNQIFLITWLIVDAASVGWLIHDLYTRNREIVGLMKFVWIFTVVYSGPIGLAVYYFSGRKQIKRDSLWRRGWRSDAHCYSGCGGGEIAGVFIAAGLLSLSNWWIAGITFAMAYVAGFGMTVGPLVQEGIPLKTALKDAFISETASITVMEVTAIGVDLALAAEATIGDVLFWSSLIFSLSVGLFAAYPVNVLLIKLGVKEGMHDPRKMASHSHGRSDKSAESRREAFH